MNKSKQFVIKMFGRAILIFTHQPGLGYLMLLGVILHWKDTSRHRLYFSERMGIKKAWTVRGWRISLNKYKRY